MGWCQLVLIVTFVVLLQCGLPHAATCTGRKTVIQIKIPDKTNINVKFPPESGAVKFVPYPYPNKDGKYDADCYTCNGPSCQKCTNQTQNPFPTFPQGYNPQRTNIIIDLRRTNSPSTSTNKPIGEIPQKDGTVVVLQDSTSASSASKSATSGSSKNGASTAASSASSATTSDTDIIASFDQNNAGGSNGNTEDIFVEDASKSIAGSSAISKIATKSKSASETNKGSSGPTSKTTSASAGKATAKTENGGNSQNLGKFESGSNADTSGGKATSSAGGISGADAITGGASNAQETISKVTAISSTEDVEGVVARPGTVSSLSKAAADDDDDYDDLDGLL